MFLMMTDFRNQLLILLVITIFLGTILVLGAGYLTDNYFSNMVSGLIGDYGEYDLLLTLAQDKEEIALAQIESVVENGFKGSQLEQGPRVVGSSNYLLKLSEENRNEEFFANINRYFSDIPGLISKTIIAEPRLSIRGFRGDTLQEIKPLIDDIAMINFTFTVGNNDGLDIIVQKPEQIPEVKNRINAILEKYKLLEIRYPLNQHPQNLQNLKEIIMETIDTKINVNEVKDVTTDTESERVSLLKSLKQMKTFLLSYATKIVVKDIENSGNIPVGSELIIADEENQVILKVIDNEDDRLTSLIQSGEIGEIESRDVYLRAQDGNSDKFLGKARINNPRQELEIALEKLNDIKPKLDGFLEHSEELINYSDRLGQDLDEINNGLTEMGSISKKLNKSLQEWQEQKLSRFLKDLSRILDNIKENTGNINQIQAELIKTSNRLKGVSGLIEEKLIYVPRNNDIYSQLDQLKQLFLQMATGLDENYDVVEERLADMGPLLDSIDKWKIKINSLLKIEDTLNKGSNWQQIEDIIVSLDETSRIIDTSDLQQQLTSIQNLLLEIQTTQLPVILEQLNYIKQSLPDLKESEIIETINLIDKYIAGQVIPGDQIQLLIEGDYNNNQILNLIKPLINNPAVSYINMNAGALQTNPRGEVFNVLRQVRAVISTVIALIFTLLILILDQSLIVSVIRLNNGHGYFYSFISGSIIFSIIYFLSQISFPYLNLYSIILIGGVLGLTVGLFSGMLNPVSKEEWEAGKALGFSSAEIMQEIIIPSGKPGLLYLINYPRVVFK